VGEDTTSGRSCAGGFELQYERNDVGFARNRFRVRGDTVEVFPAYEERAVRLQLFGDEIERISSVDPVTGEVVEDLQTLVLFPASHYVTPEDHLRRAIEGIESELADRLAWLEERGKLLEAQRLRMRTTYDLEMLREVGVCNGIENYSRHLDGPGAGPGPLHPPRLLPSRLPLRPDQSHVVVPQLHGQYEGDRSRKETLVEHGFRLPSALDNRPLRFEEFDGKVNQVVFMSATPGAYELQVSSQVVEQIVRPTGLVDPEVIVRPTKGQIDDLVAEIRLRAERDQRVLVTTLTKKMSGPHRLPLDRIRSATSTRIDTLVGRILRACFSASSPAVGINLLRGGLDVPECRWSILDATGASSAPRRAWCNLRRRRATSRPGRHVRRPRRDSMPAIPRPLRAASALEYNAEHASTRRRSQAGHRHLEMPQSATTSAAAGAGAGAGGDRATGARVFELAASHPTTGRLVQPRGGDARGGEGPPLRGGRPAARRDLRAEAGAARRGVTTAARRSRRGTSGCPGRPDSCRRTSVRTPRRPGTM